MWLKWLDSLPNTVLPSNRFAGRRPSLASRYRHAVTPMGLVGSECWFNIVLILQTTEYTDATTCRIIIIYPLKMTGRKFSHHTFTDACASGFFQWLESTNLDQVCGGGSSKRWREQAKLLWSPALISSDSWEKPYLYVLRIYSLVAFISYFNLVSFKGQPCISVCRSTQMRKKSPPGSK